MVVRYNSIRTVDYKPVVANRIMGEFMDNAKLSRWAELLLDTDKRNRPVNYPDTKSSTVEVGYLDATLILGKVGETSFLEAYDPRLEKHEFDIADADGDNQLFVQGYQCGNTPEKTGQDRRHFVQKLSALLTALLMLMILASCGDTEAPHVDPKTDSQAQESTTPVTEDAADTEHFVVAPQSSLDWPALLLLPDPVPAESNPEQRMAHNIYSDPALLQTSRAFSGFLIDFCADYAPAGTYWALCNWTMDVTDLSEHYTVTDGGAAYAGLQKRIDGDKAIMSFWEIHYLDEAGKDITLRAKRVYPEAGATNTFEGEGEGTNYITDYPWERGKWYRMYLCCYEDTVGGHTFVEQWLEDIASEEWTKISCFDTGLTNSFFTGDMSQFMENYDSSFCNETRSFAYRNLYVRDYSTGEWIGIHDSRLSVDTWWDNKKGSFAYTADKCTLYGITNGYGEDTAQLDADISNSFSIESTEPPHLPGETRTADNNK